MKPAIRGNIAMIPPNEGGVGIMKDHNNAIRFGINTPFRENDKGELVSILPEQDLAEAISQVCKTWGFPDPSVFALKFIEAPGHYVTEITRKHIRGKVVSMVHSPAKVIADILDKLKADATMVAGLKELSEKASDPTIADVFIKNDGLPVLVDIIGGEKMQNQEGLAYAFQSILDIIASSSIISWDQLEQKVLSKVVGYVNSPNRPPSERLALKPALELLENVVSAGVSYAQIEKDLTLPVLVTHVKHPDTVVQQNALALVNALLIKADINKKHSLTKTLASQKYRTIVLNSVINKGDERSAETSHQLYVLQTLLLNLTDDKRRTPIDPQDQDSLNRIKYLCKTAFDSDFNSFASGNLPNFTREYRKLGFQNDVNPALDFQETPPGILALDCMHHLASTQQEVYNKLVVECAYRGAGEEFLLPFARASIALTNVLCDLLKVGEAPSDQPGKFHPFFFQHDKPFEEVFCICAQLVTKTWKEMRATTEDFDKVFDVIREQIRRALDKMPETFKKFQEYLNKLTYVEIQNLRAQERSSREEDELHAKPIQELKKKLMPEILALIRQNRKNFMIAGTRFYSKVASKSSASGTLKKAKEKYWFCRLSPNEKVLHYGDCEEKTSPTPEELSNKVSVLDLQELLTGKDCPHIDKKSRNAHLAFSLVTEKDPLQTVDFIAPDEKAYALWTDGINALLGKPMTSKEAENDLEILLHMEIKLRLLDIEGILIPHEPPPIPPPPPNFDFAVFVK